MRYVFFFVTLIVLGIKTTSSLSFLAGRPSRVPQPFLHHRGDQSLAPDLDRLSNSPGFQPGGPLDPATMHEGPRVPAEYGRIRRISRVQNRASPGPDEGERPRLDLTDLLGLDSQDLVNPAGLDMDEDAIVKAPIDFDRTSPEWKMAMINYLMTMKANGKNLELVDSGNDEEFQHDKNVVCKVAPYRVCYRMGEDGKLRPLGKAQPVNILRVYKK